MTYSDENHPGRMVKCARETYLGAVESAGGLEALTPLSSYTRIDGDRWGPGRRIDTVWGHKDGTPVCESSLREIKNERECLYWVWEAAPTLRAEDDPRRTLYGVPAPKVGK